MTKPKELESLDPNRIVDVDVRDDLRAGREPFQRIMAARRALRDDGVLRVRALFEPQPLYAVFGREGFARWTERLAEDDWRVWFYRLPQVTELDVRGLEPPEPLHRTLEALASLPPGHTLVQINDRVPRFLLPELERRGFRYTIEEEDPRAVRVLIWHASA